ncbi:MAG: hypothetical protein WCT40_04580 [Candidatus Magasanikbacteria bacterium]
MCLSAAILLAHIFLVSVAPYPYNSVNIIIASVLWLILIFGKQSAIWMVVPVGFCLELFSVVPFGLILTSLVLSLSIMGWLMLHFFTNRSLYIVVLSAFFAIILYRSIFISGLLLLDYWQIRDLSPNNGALVGIIYELIFTPILLLFVYALSGILVRRFRPEYINFHSRGNYGQITKSFWRF